MSFPPFSSIRSVGGTVLFILVCVNTLLLALFGVFDYQSEKKRLETALHHDLASMADQLAANLDESLWYLETAHISRLMDSAMQNERVASVVVTEHDQKSVTVGRARDRSWQPAPLAGLPAMENVVTERRELSHAGSPVGRLEISMSRRFMDHDLRATLSLTVLRIVGLNAALAIVLVVVLRRQIIVPLARLERHANQITLGETPAIPPELRGELLSLAMAMEEMVRRITSTQRQYRDLIAHATEGIFQSTLDGRLLAANAALARMTGYDSPAALIEAITDVASQLYNDPRDRQAMLDQLLAAGSVTGYQIRFLRRDKQTIWISLNARLVRDEDNRPLYLEGTVVDVSATVRAERRLEILNRHLRDAVKERTRRLAEKAAELEQANQRLTELDQLKSGFLATVSHDLRTPLTSIMGFAKLISRDFHKFFAPFASGHERLTRQAERIGDNLSIIESEGERLTRLINDFLDLSKIEAGRAQWRDAQVDTAGLLARAASAVSADFEAKPEVTFSMNIPPDLPPLFIDPDRLSQVLLNLLGNAAKFTDAGSVRLTATATADCLRVEVADTGQGVSRDSLEKIFDKFHQAQAGDTVADLRQRQGTGLGLAICRQIVEHYEGHIWCESELGRGSTFVMELPLSQPLPQA